MVSYEMGEVKELTQIDVLAVLLGMFVIIFAIKEIIEVFYYFKKRFRIKTGFDTDKETIENRISVLEENDKLQYAQVSKISDGIDKLQKNLLDKTIEDYRHIILDMASAISTGRKYSKEQYEYVLSIHTKYENILEENGLQNGQVDISVQVIKEKYKDGLTNGF